MTFERSRIEDRGRRWRALGLEITLTNSSSRREVLRVRRQDLSHQRMRVGLPVCFALSFRHRIFASAFAPSCTYRFFATTSLHMSATLTEGDILFGKFVIPKASIFYQSEKKSAGFVNLRPIVPGHVLVVPERVVPLFDDLSPDEYTDLWLSVREVQAMLRKHYGCSAFNVAVQDGRAAGQSVPHVHVHILPRSAGDFTRNDDIYDALQEWAPREEMQSKIELVVPEDGDRRDRTRQEMADEAAQYRSYF